MCITRMFAAISNSFNKTRFWIPSVKLFIYTVWPLHHRHLNPGSLFNDFYSKSINCAFADCCWDPDFPQDLLEAMCIFL